MNGVWRRSERTRRRLITRSDDGHIDQKHWRRCDCETKSTFFRSRQIQNSPNGNKATKSQHTSVKSLHLDQSQLSNRVLVTRTSSMPPHAIADSIANAGKLIVRTKRIMLVALAIAFACEARAQSSLPSVIAKSSNLSSALPPREWVRLETGVDRGLDWLSRQQEKDGRFPSEDAVQPAITSLAVMAFLSRGHVPDRGQYGAQLSKAIDFVLSTQRRQGEFSFLPVEPPAGHMLPGQTSTYNHSIAGLMLGEVYGMTAGDRSRKIESAINRALIYHREIQSRTKQTPHDIGGWRYGFPDSPDASSDMSVTGWGLMFLRSARNAEFNVPKQYFDEGLDFVERCYEKDSTQHELGIFRYRPLLSDPKGNPQISLANTSSAMLTLVLGGRQDHESIGVGAKWFQSHDYPRHWQIGYFYLSTYYSSQAMSQVGGETWNKVFPQIARNLLNEQAADGSWPSEVSSERKFGSNYTTSLAILALTPPYQLLPIFQR